MTQYQWSPEPVDDIPFVELARRMNNDFEKKGTNELWADFIIDADIHVHWETANCRASG